MAVFIPAFFRYKEGNNRRRHMSEINVRQATAAEAGRIAGFNRAMAMETEGLALDEQTVASGVVALLGHPERGFYLVAEINGAMAGCIKVHFEWTAWRNRMFWWIGSCYVKPEYRGCDVHGAIYRKLEELAAREGNICGFRSYVHQDDVQGQQVYRGLGMAEKRFMVFEDML